VNFKDFFKKLDDNLDKLQLRSYSVGITTLEEVFLKIGEKGDEKNILRQSDIQMTSNDKRSLINPNDKVDTYTIAEES
jgi:hypothetical protein